MSNGVLRRCPSSETGPSLFQLLWEFSICIDPHMAANRRYTIHWYLIRFVNLVRLEKQKN